MTHRSRAGEPAEDVVPDVWLTAASAPSLDRSLIVSRRSPFDALAESHRTTVWTELRVE
jgi:hypothetical protein